MKLNNRGWGFKEMIILTSILLIFLFVASYYIFVLYSSLGATPGSRYAELETNMILAAKKYIKNKGNANHLTSSELKDLGYLGSFYDGNGDNCIGYVLINEDYQSFISCNHYKTPGYSIKYE